jgi:hypothetical protein
LKDAGIDSPIGLVATNVVTGMVDGYRAEPYLTSQRMAASKPVTNVTLLAGAAFFVAAGDGIRAAIASFNAPAPH